jgi:hypothetical protein
MAAEAYPTLFAGQRVLASLVRSMQTQTLRKTADTSITASTTQTTDPHIQMTVAANAVYEFWGWIQYDADLTGDLSVGWTSPAGSQGTWMGHGGGTTVTSATAGGGTQQNATSTWGYNIRLEPTDITTGRTFGGLAVGNKITVLFQGTLRTSVVGGTFGLAWAQSASSATATTLYTDSWLAVLRSA